MDYLGMFSTKATEVLGAVLKLVSLSLIAGSSFVLSCLVSYSCTCSVCPTLRSPRVRKRGLIACLVIWLCDLAADVLVCSLCLSMTVLDLYNVWLWYFLKNSIGRKYHNHRTERSSVIIQRGRANRGRQFTTCTPKKSKAITSVCLNTVNVITVLDRIH